MTTAIKELEDELGVALFEAARRGVSLTLEWVSGMVAAGLGVTILADIVYRPWPLEGSRIQVREVIEPVPSLDVGAAWRRGKPLSNAAEAFRKFLALASRELSTHSPV